MTTSPATAQHLRDPAWLRRVGDRIDREYAHPLDVEAHASINLATADLDGAFERLQAADGAEVVQEPIDQPYGIRDGAVRDPAGNLIRIQELR